MKNTMTTKKIDKIIVYYQDGTYEEIKTSVHDLAHKQDPYPSYAPKYQPVTFPVYPPGVRGTGIDPRTPCWTSTHSEDKYTVTTNSTGNVDLSK